MNKAAALWALAAIAASSLQQGRPGVAAEPVIGSQPVHDATLFFLDDKTADTACYVAAHRSHRSHSSHRSHYSSRGGYSSPSYRTPVYSPPSPSVPFSSPPGVGGSSTEVRQTAPPYDAKLVKSIQTGLKKLGFYAGKIDGLYGKGTRNGILAFEMEQGLPQTGIPSPWLDEQIKLMVP